MTLDEIREFTEMADYFGKYLRFYTVSKKEAGLLLSADNMIGDVDRIDLRMEEGKHVAWLVNRFDKEIGYFDAHDSRELALVKANGAELRAILAFVAFTESADDGQYWGEAAVIGVDPMDSGSFETFVGNVSDKMASGVRIQVDLGKDGVRNVVDSNGNWLPKQIVPLPENEKGTAILKKQRRVTDRLIEQGRAGNKGCYIASWALMLATVALIVYAIVAVFN